MVHLRNSPFLFLALLVLLTQVLGHWMVCKAEGWLILVCLVPAGIAAGIPYRRSPWPGTLALAFLVMVATRIRVASHQESLFGKSLTPEGICLDGQVRVVSVFRSSDEWVTAKCRPIKLESPDGVHYPDQFLLLRVYRPRAPGFLPGDVLEVSGIPERIQGAMNPKGWDARRHYRSLGMRYSLFIRGADLVFDKADGGGLMRLAASWQRALSQTTARFLDKQNAQLTNALVWGDRSDMDAGIRDAFAGAGAMHVLSVSGMHVAMVYTGLLLLLGDPVRARGWRKWIRFGTGMSAIAGYVLVTGAPPAAVRAGLMIVLYQLGRILDRDTQGLNLLGLAALVQWWVDPDVAARLGFQLSFLAMAGLLLFTRPIQHLLPVRNRFLHWLWSIAALSLAAQVFILPLLLFHFHQFPLTFLLSSFVAIPAGYAVIFGAIASLLLNFMGWHVAWPWLDWIAGIVIRSMEFLANLNPLMHSAFPVTALVTAYGAVILLCAAWMYKRPRSIHLAAACLAACILCMAAHRTVQWERDEVVVYHVRKGWLCDWFRGGEVMTFRSEGVEMSGERFAAGAYRAFKDIRDRQVVINANKEADDRGAPSLLPITGYPILVWPIGGGEEPLAQPAAILVTGLGEYCRLENHLLSYDPEILLAACLPYREKRIVQGMLERIGSHAFDIGEQGAYKHSL